MMIPEFMPAIEVEADSLQLTARPTPKPASHQVLIKVVAAGVNRPDISQRKGLYPRPAGASDILGLEVAGTIVIVGAAVSHLKVGDNVCALVTGGGYAGYCLASALLCLPIPTGLSFIEAAALPENFFTVWSNLFDRAHLVANETVLIHGGSSGIGCAAIQLAKAFHANVIVTVGSEEKCQVCLDLGADAAINYHEQDFVEVVQSLTNGKGVDVILDIIGGDYFPRNLKCLAYDGRLVQIALQHAIKSEINLLPVMVKRLTITGSTLRARDDAFKTAIANQLHKHVWSLLSAGLIQPVIDSTFMLDEAERAHELMESSLHIGKIILEI
jgi:NADPH2:quinone reductase